MSENIMRIIDLRGKNLSRAELLAAMPRAAMGTSEATDLVRPILDDVKERGAAALRDFEEKFDHVRPEHLRVPVEAMTAALETLDPEVRAAIEESVRRARAVAANQVPKDFYTDLAEGARVAERWIPIQRVGLYVPGGQGGNTPLLSSMLMNAIPALVAGVPRVAVCTPPRKDGTINPHILAAAHLLDIDEIYRVGGAWSIGAMAYGTQSIPAVDKIVGPGNIYVATAKRKVFGKVGIDMIAGPSEILVLADGSCNPAWVAADLLSQAEHDKLASPVLVTDSAALAKAVQAELEVQIPQLPRAAIARASVDDNGKIILCTDLHKAIEACNIIAPEHLEVCVEDPFGVLNEIKNAGSIFLGRNVPEALGDYFAGPNHTLPTSGTARFSSPLGVDDFVKKSSFIYYTRDALEAVAPRIADFAEREGLHAHARSVTIRYEK